MADVELLPLPSEVRLAIRAYARACVEANLAPLQAENERLAEVLRLHIEDLERSAVVLDQYPAMAPTAAEMRKAAAELRAALHPTAAQAAENERLRDALETIAAYPYSRDQEMGAAAMRKVARDALAQEDRNG